MTVDLVEVMEPDLVLQLGKQAGGRIAYETLVAQPALASGVENEATPLTQL